MKLLLLLVRPSHLARREAKVVKVQVAQRTLKSSSGTAAKPGSGKGSKRIWKEAGLTEKPR